MRDPVDALILDLLEWIGPSPRPYREVMVAVSALGAKFLAERRRRVIVPSGG